MKHSLHLLLLAFYSFGTLCLPMGNFAMLEDLPAMYSHCQATEDKDLNLLEFVTEHLLPFGQWIEGAEEHEHDGDKPHESFQNMPYAQAIAVVETKLCISFAPRYSKVIEQQLLHNDPFIVSNYSAKVFRPPIYA